MTIEPGARLGHYQVVEAIGAGGMGEVYRARDLKLGREVAIKVLPEAFSKEDERLARFEREAKLLAQLNHPGIATLHGLEEHDGLEFLVMELVEGETLADRLRRRPIPLESALPLFCQIAEALDAAHNKGVLHRDLKPPNIMVTEDEHIKILDFGLAKAMVTETETETESPTISRGTETGVVLGTPAYMSPEQARGLSLDERSDIWSFGCVLYETLTGRTCFGGNTVSDTIASILKESPQWDGLPTTTPKALERLLRRCLQKDPRQRLRDIGDARLDIQEILDQPDLASVDMRPRARPSMIPWAVSAVLLTVIIFLVFVGTESGDRERLQVVSVATPPGTSVQTVVVSPDGSALAIVAAEREGTTSLWVRDLDSATARRLPGTEGAAYPFWSPDGRNLGFFSGSQLNKTVAQGGPVEALAEVPSARGGSWGPSGTIVLTMAGDSTLFRIPETGGEPTPVTVQTPGENSHRYPSFLPDGKHVIYFARNPVSPELGGVWVASLDGNTPPRQLVDAHSLAVYAHPGFLIYRRGEHLIAQRFDASALTFTDDPVPIVDEVWFDPAFSGLANFSASDNGMLTYRGGGIEKTTLTWYDRGGNELEQLGEAANYLNLYLSPGDELVAVSKTNERTESRDLWLIDVEAGTPRQLTFNPASDFAPLWVETATRSSSRPIARGNSISTSCRPSEGPKLRSCS